MKLEVPMALPSRGNITHAHWSGRSRLVKKQRKALRGALLFHTAPAQGPLTIRLTRVAPRVLDKKDNNPIAMKAVRDQISEWLGYKDDDHPDLRWFYARATDAAERPGYTAARIEITEGHTDCDACGSELAQPLEQQTS